MTEKKELHLCMGSGCHQMGGYHVLQQLEALLVECGLTDSVELKGAFCLGPCSSGVVVRVGDKDITHVCPENVRPKFFEEIYPCLKP